MDLGSNNKASPVEFRTGFVIAIPVYWAVKPPSMTNSEPVE